jgi:hypothetical protein
MDVTQILRLNQLAVDLLLAEESRQAYKVLHAALQGMLRIMQSGTPPVVVANTFTSCTDGNDTEVPCATGTLTIRLSTTTHGDGSSSSFTNDSLFQLYDAVFRVSNNNTEESNMLPQDYQDFVVAVLMYNTGLVCHRLGVQQRKFKNLRRALSMYEAAYSTLHRVETLKDDIVMVGFLRLALINNMGHIYSNLFHRDQASACQKLLQDLIRPTIVNTCAIEDPECIFFFECLLFLELETLAAPAA